VLAQYLHGRPLYPVVPAYPYHPGPQFTAIGYGGEIVPSVVRVVGAFTL